MASMAASLLERSRVQILARERINNSEKRNYSFEFEYLTKFKQSNIRLKFGIKNRSSVVLFVHYKG